MKLNILYEDNHIIVCVKPVGVLSQSDGSKTIDMLSILKQYIKEKYKKPGNVYLGLVHRLDKDVSGVMVFARTSKAASRLSNEVRNHEIKKKYMCVVEGIFKEKEGVLEDLLLRQEYSTIVSKKGLPSSLKYKVIDEKDNYSLLDIDLITGRHHQIRVQLSSRNHSILGDTRYGNTSKYKIALICYSLSFYHPTTKEFLTFKIDKPTNGYFSLFS